MRIQPLLGRAHAPGQALHAGAAGQQLDFALDAVEIHLDHVDARIHPLEERQIRHAQHRLGDLGVHVLRRRLELQLALDAIDQDLQRADFLGVGLHPVDPHRAGGRVHDDAGVAHALLQVAVGQHALQQLRGGIAQAGALRGEDRRVLGCQGCQRRRQLGHLRHGLAAGDEAQRVVQAFGQVIEAVRDAGQRRLQRDRVRAHTVGQAAGGVDRAARKGPAASVRPRRLQLAAVHVARAQDGRERVPIGDRQGPLPGRVPDLHARQVAGPLAVGVAPDEPAQLARHLGDRERVHVARRQVHGGRAVGGVGQLAQAARCVERPHLDEPLAGRVDADHAAVSRGLRIDQAQLLAVQRGPHLAVIGRTFHVPRKAQFVPLGIALQIRLFRHLQAAHLGARQLRQRRIAGRGHIGALVHVGPELLRLGDHGDIGALQVLLRSDRNHPHAQARRGLEVVAPQRVMRRVVFGRARQRHAIGPGLHQREAVGEAIGTVERAHAEDAVGALAGHAQADEGRGQRGHGLIEREHHLAAHDGGIDEPAAEAPLRHVVRDRQHRQAAVVEVLDVGPEGNGFVLVEALR